MEMRSAKLRQLLRPRLFELPQIPPANHPDIEIHMLCGKKHLDMAIWASWSILRFLKNAVLYVHPDGTLVPENVDSWSKVVKGIVFISKQQSDKKVRAELANRCFLLYDWHRNYRHSPQVVDVQLFGQTDKIVIVDSDVLYFKDPIELRLALSNKDAVYRWNKDVRSFYCANIELLEQMTGLKLPEAFNCGFCLAPRFGKSQFDHIEQMLRLLKADGRVQTDDLWSAQTYFTMCAALDNRSEAFPMVIT
jgi:hypothetical protein